MTCLMHTYRKTSEQMSSVEEDEVGKHSEERETSGRKRKRISGGVESVEDLVRIDLFVQHTQA